MKKVAIIGAGISGLSCALELKRHGITPMIFERRSRIGEVMEYPTLMLRMIIKSAINPVKYLKKEFNLEIKPLFPLKKLTLISQNQRKFIYANHGSIFLRGSEQTSLENQISEQLGLPVYFDHYIKLDDIRYEFDHIVVATGDNAIGIKLGVWETTFFALNRVSTIVGDFETKSVISWFDTRYTKNAFAYLIPESPKKAKLCKILNNSTPSDLEYYWKEFLSSNNFSFDIIETKDMEHTCGFVYPVQLGNVYFVGNCAGTTDSLIGVGAFRAIQSGFFAARSIINQIDYNTLMKPIIGEIRALNEFRKVFNTFDNDSYDKLVSTLGFPVIKQIVYNNPFFKLAYGEFVAKGYNKLVYGSRKLK